MVSVWLLGFRDILLFIHSSNNQYDINQFLECRLWLFLLWITTAYFLPDRNLRIPFIGDCEQSNKWSSQVARMCDSPLPHIRVSFLDILISFKWITIYVLYIYNRRFASMLNDKLVVIISSQFMVTISVVCCLLFRLTVLTSNFMYIETIMCIAVALLALSYYCWFGNEVRLKVNSQMRRKRKKKSNSM